MWMDGGAAVRSADGVAGVTGAFQNKLLRQSATAGDLAQYYRDRIGGVTSDADLLADDQLLAVALGAFGLGSLAGDKTTVQRLLTEDPTAPGSLAQQNADYGRFAAEFASLKSDGGAKVHGLADIDSLATSYLGAESGRLAALDQPAARSGLYGTAGEKAIGTLLTNFTSSTGYKQAVAYYGANIGKVTSVDGLLKDSQLLGVALSAFRMDGLAQSPATLRQLLTEDPDAADSLARTDPRYMAFARAFAPLKDGNSVGGGTSVDAVIASYQAHEFEKSLDSKAKQSLSSDGKVTIYQVLSDKTLAAVMRGALGLPDQTAALDLDQQVRAMTRAGFDADKLQDPTSLGRLIQRFLLNNGTQSSAAVDPLMALFGVDTSGGSGNPMLSLFGGGGSGGGGSGGLVSLLA
jgi:hypothetical protein